MTSGPEPLEPQHPWRDLDDTLADGPAGAAVPPAAKPWLAEQRVMHGLLRALHTADAGARESRIQGVLERIAGERSAAGPAVRHWLLVAAAALCLALGGLWVALPARLPTADAAVARAVAELARDVDRRFKVEIEAAGRGGEGMHHEFALVARPGGKFRIDGKLAFGGMQFGELRIGCDGQELWVLPANGMFRSAVPLAERERLLNGLGEALDLGYLDVHDLVRRLPDDCELRVVGRQTGADGRPQLQIAATRRAGAGGGEPGFAGATLVCDEASGMVVQIVAEAQTRFGITRRLRLDYLGEESPALVDYRRPW